MVGGTDLKRLAVRKAALLVESGVNRLNLDTGIRECRAWIGNAAGKSRKAAPWLVPVVGAFGFFAARRFRGTGKYVSLLAAGLRLARPLMALWGLRGRPAPEKPE